MGLFSGEQTPEEVVVPKPPRPSALETGAFGTAAGTLGISVGTEAFTRKQRKALGKLFTPEFQPILDRLEESFADPRGIFGISTEGLTGKQRKFLKNLQQSPKLQPVLGHLRGLSAGPTEEGPTVATDLERERALEEEQLDIQRQFLQPAGDLQQRILQTFLQNLTPEGIGGIQGLVGDAFARTALEGERRIDQFFQNAGFDPAGTTPAAQARGEFEGVLASAKAQAIIDQLNFSLTGGLQASGQSPFVPQFQGPPLPSTGLGIGLGQAQTGLGGTLGQIRLAGFKPQVLGGTSQGPSAPGLFGGIGALGGGLIGLGLGGPAGAAVGAGLGGIGGSTLGTALSR